MIALDTNVLVRIYVGDDPAQQSSALELIDGMADGEKAIVNSIVVVELLWTLKRVYRFERHQLAAVVRNLTDHKRLLCPDKDLLREAAHRLLEWGGDLSDHLIGLKNRADGARTTYTFDRDASRSPDFSLLHA